MFTDTMAFPLMAEEGEERERKNQNRQWRKKDIHFSLTINRYVEDGV